MADEFKHPVLGCLGSLAFISLISVLGYRGCSSAYHNYKEKEKQSLQYIASTASTLRALPENQTEQSQTQIQYPEDVKRILPDDLLKFNIPYTETGSKISFEIDTNKLRERWLGLVYPVNLEKTPLEEYPILCYKVKTHNLAGFRLEAQITGEKKGITDREELRPGGDLEYLVESDLTKLTSQPLSQVSELKWIIGIEHFTWSGPKFEISDIYLKKKERGLK